MFNKAKPDFDYLKLHMNITNMAELKKALLIKCNKLDFKTLAGDMEPFLVNPGDTKKVLLFRDYIKNMDQE